MAAGDPFNTQRSVSDDGTTTEVHVELELPTKDGATRRVEHVSERWDSKTGERLDDGNG